MAEFSTLKAEMYMRAKKVSKKYYPRPARIELWQVSRRVCWQTASGKFPCAGYADRGSISNRTLMELHSKILRAVMQ